MSLPRRDRRSPVRRCLVRLFRLRRLIGTYGPLWFQSLGYSTLAIGALTSLQAGTRLFTPYAWGWLADHTGRRERLLRVAAGGALLASLGFFFPAGYAWVATVTVVLFICTAGVIPISEATLAYRVSSEGRLDVGRYGRVRMWGSVGFVGAVTASGFILQAIGVGRFPALRRRPAGRAAVRRVEAAGLGGARRTTTRSSPA